MHLRQLACILAGCVSSVAVPSVALAAFTPASTIPPLQELGVTTGVAGQATVFGIDASGSVVAAAHATGSADFQPARTIVQAAGADESGATGNNGTFAVRTDAANVVVGQIGPSGEAARPPVTLRTEGLDPLAVAVAPGGAIVAMLRTGSGELRAYAVAPGGTRLNRVGQAVAPADVTAAAISATGPEAFHVVWVEAPEDAAASVRSTAVTTSTIGQPSRTLTSETLPFGAAVASPSVAVNGADIVGGWIQTGADSRVFARVRSISGFREGMSGASFAGLGPVNETTVTAGPPGTFVVTYSGDGSPSSSGAAVIAADTSTRCAVRSDARLLSAVPRGAGYGLSGLIGTRLSESDLVTAGDNCGASSLTSGPDAGEAQLLASAIDAEGTLALAGSSEASTVISADDRVAPSATTDVPDAAQEGERPVVRVAAADAWGVKSINWTLDGEPVGSGPEITLPPLKAGERTVAVDVVDRAGLRTSRASTIRVRASAPAPEVSPAQPPAAAPPTTAAAAAPPPSTDPPRVEQVAEVPPPTRSIAGVVRARVVSVRLLGVDGRPSVDVRVVGAKSVRIMVLRETFQRRERSRCGRPGVHQRAGKQGVLNSAVTASQRVRVAFSPALTRSLRSRGRYQLRVVALGAEGQRSRAVSIRLTVC